MKPKPSTKKPASGPSGHHKNPRFLISGTEKEIETWSRAAAAAGTNRVEWLRALANAAAAKLGFR